MLTEAEFRFGNILDQEQNDSGAYVHSSQSESSFKLARLSLESFWNLETESLLYIAVLLFNKWHACFSKN